MPTSRQPIYDINDYLLNGVPTLGALLGWPNPTGIRPIVPTQQQPETNERNGTAPYIVYSFRTAVGTDSWWIRTDDASYVIWGSNHEQLSEIANEMLDAFHALDESAGDLMAYLDGRGVPPEFIFHYIRVLGSISPQPALQEGGRLAWIITLRYEYSLASGSHLG